LCKKFKNMRTSSVLLLGAILIGVYITTSEAGCNTITSGTKVGIKHLEQGGHWLGCKPVHKCNSNSCPGLTFPAEKAHCEGEIFSIYKKQGSGIIRIGDEVGLYYIHTREWVSLWDNDGGVVDCPGLPSPTLGMNTLPGQCLGEVFRVYAHGKAVGEPLEDKDTIMLNYKAGGEQWFSLWKGTSRKDDCPGAALPPPTSRYETCPGEVFEIRKLDFVHIRK
jgi:hypothetical protein